MKTNLLALAALIANTLSAGAISINTFGSAYTENFDALASSSTANTTLPAGWHLAESGTSTRNNGAYAPGTGSDSAGDVYSYGTASSSERAFGTLLSNTLAPFIGGSFQNDTGGTITSLLISYWGEQWRLGALGRVDQLEFQYSLDATSLTTGSWADVDALDFVAPIASGTVGALNGNLSANRLLISDTIGALSIGNGTAFWLRWSDINAIGADDGLAVDDFSLTAQGFAPPPSVPDTGTTALLLAMPLLGLFAIRRLATRVD
jgi:hypothetical protein